VGALKAKQLEYDMAKSVNKVVLLGNVGQDPEVKYTARGVPVAKVCRRLSTKLCLRESCGSLEAGLEHGIELGKYGTDGPARSFPTALLQGGDS
jgi:hypothetical protein